MPPKRVKPYDRLKLHRYLRRKQNIKSNNVPKVQNEVLCDIECSAGMNVYQSQGDTSETPFIAPVPMDASDNDELIVSNSPAPSNESIISISSNSPHPSDDEDFIQQVEQQASFYEKIHSWAVSHLSTLTHVCIEDLLTPLREEGFKFPICASTLLRSFVNDDIEIRPMASLHEKFPGEYAYIGIARALNDVIDTNVYKEEAISLLINIDGASMLGEQSADSLWPILGKVFSREYDSTPFMIACFYGQSKPGSANEYLRDFVNEVKHLIANGIIINNVKYKFIIIAFICDMPARAFLKCCKGHGGFFCCERCYIMGFTVIKPKNLRDKPKKKVAKKGEPKEKQSKTRCYTDINAQERSNESFRRQDQIEHHSTIKVDGHFVPLMSILLEIESFDPIKHFLIDSMHLFCIGVPRDLLNYWITNSGPAAQIIDNKEMIHRFFKQLFKRIVCEFQRKDFDIYRMHKWKATQFRFIMLYCGDLIARQLCDEDTYKHFLLIFYACRLLFRKGVTDNEARKAKKILRTFVALMPTYYHVSSVVMNFHNIIHVADDVINMQASLSEMNAFEFENFLGKIVPLIRSPKNPVRQILRRLAEIKSRPKYVSRKRTNPIYGRVTARDGEIRVCHKRRAKEQLILGNNYTVTTESPNNIVQLADGQFIQVQEISVIDGVTSIHGHQIETRSAFYIGKLKSKTVGVVKKVQIDPDLFIAPATFIKTKCMQFEAFGETRIITMLH